MGSELRHERFLFGIHSGEDRVRRAGFTVNGADSHAGPSRGGATVPGIATSAIAACESIHVARIALEGIFLRGGGGAVHGGRAHRLCGALLCCGATFRTVGASLVGLLLIRSNSFYFKVSGMVVALAAAAPLLFAAISYLSRGRFEPDEDLLNQAAPVPEISLAAAPEEISASVSARRYDALSSGL